MRRVTVLVSEYSTESLSGENHAVQDQIGALSSSGYDVDVVARKTLDGLGEVGYKTQSALRVATGVDIGSKLPPAEGPQHILLVNNLFPNFGARILNSWQGTVVYLIHNFRSRCINGLFLRGGDVCTKCLDDGPVHGLVHRCYRDSMAASLPLVVGRLTGASDVPLRVADAVVVQTETAQSVFERELHDPGKLHLVPGFVTSGQFQADGVSDPSREWLFVGRLTKEKGLRELLSIWPSSESLDVIGDGPEKDQLKPELIPGLSMLGEMSRHDVRELMPLYRGLVFPGVAWEGAHPLVLREAWAAGLPVVAAEGSSASSVIRTFGGGATFVMEDAGSLAAALNQVRHSAELRHEARELASTVFSENRWIGQMEDVFQEAVARREETKP